MANHYNYAAAFVEFTKGTSLEEVAMALVIPIDRLRRRCHDENWSALAPRLQVGLVQVDSHAERGLERIKANRERNLEVAQLLQEDLLQTVRALRDDTLRTTKVTAKGDVIELSLGMRERADLANYAKNIAELSYRALGDIEQSKNAVPEGGLVGAQQITIILPGAVAVPRRERVYDVESTLVSTDQPLAKVDAG